MSSPVIQRGGGGHGPGALTASGTPTVGQVALWVDATHLQGSTLLPGANFPALTGDVTAPGAVTVLTVAKLGILTTDGLVQTSGGTGTLSVVTTTGAVQFGRLGLGGAAPATAGMLAQTGGANNLTLHTLKRFTDTSPTGNFVDYQSAAGASLCSIAVSGAVAFTVGATLSSATAGAAGTLTFRDAATPQWAFVKQTDNTFLFYDAVTPQTLWTTSRGSIALSLTPNPASLMQGLQIVQTGPTTGMQTAADQAFNTIYINGEAADIGNHSLYGLTIYYFTGGSNRQGNRIGLNVLTSVGAAGNPAGIERDHIGIVGNCQVTATLGGTNTGAGARGTVFGLNPAATATSGATNLLVVSGGECDVGILTGASARYRLGWSVIGTGQVLGADQDIGVDIGANTQPWTTGLAFTSLHGVAPVTTAGTLIGTDGVAATVTHGLDFSAYTFSSDALKTPSFTVDGSGNVSAVLLDLSGAATTLTMTRYSADGISPILVQRKARGTSGSPAAVNAGDVLANSQAQGYDGSAFATSGRLRFVTTEAWGTTAHGVYAEISTVLNTTTGLVERLRINHNGDICLGGGATPTAGKITYTAGGGLQLGAPTGGDKGADTLNAAGVYYANGTAGVSAGSFSAITAITAVNGLVTQLTGTSDERLKDILGEAESGLDALRTLVPIRYRWNARSGFSQEEVHIGFSAQNVQASLPEAVGEETWADGQAWLTLKPRAILAAVVNALRELDQRVRRLEAIEGF